MKKSHNSHAKVDVTAPKEGGFSMSSFNKGAFYDGVQIKTVSVPQNLEPNFLKKTTPKKEQTFIQGELFAFEEVSKEENSSFKKQVSKEVFEPQIFPLKKEGFIEKPIETRVFKNVEVSSFKTKAGIDVLSVNGMDGVVMCVPGSFDEQDIEKSYPKEEPLSSDTLTPPSFSSNEVSIAPFDEENTQFQHKKDALLDKANAFKSKVQEPVTNQPQSPAKKMPYNLPLMAPTTYGTPSKEGVNLLRHFFNKPESV